VNKIFCDRCNGPQDELRSKAWERVETASRRSKPYDLCPGCSVEFDRFLSGEGIQPVRDIAYSGTDHDD
jgi:hypothetical protein